jgi:diguanylate cyclase (GGDEF)-like protein
MTSRPLNLRQRGGRDPAGHGEAVAVPDDAQPSEPAAGPALMRDIQRLKARIAELESLRATDPLTGAWNRAQLACMIDVEISRSLRSGQPVTLILLDIDHFKHVNDVHGHLIGDVVLTEFVTRIRKRMRNTDLLFRWGGDEFVVLATSAGRRGGAILADSLRRAIAIAPFAGVGAISASLGVAEYEKGENAESWFRRTDEALYAAKSAGRNRIHIDGRNARPRAAGTLREAAHAGARVNAG